MPELSRFFGLVIFMFYNDHPPPHFHVRYGGQRAIIDRPVRVHPRPAIPSPLWLL